MKIVKLTFKRNGEVIAEADGVVGQSCKDLTRPFIEGLGVGDEEVQEKPAYYQTLDEEKVELTENN